MAPTTLPRRIRVNYENEPDDILGHKGNTHAGRRLSTTSNRALQFHTRDHELHTNSSLDNNSISSGTRYKSKQSENVIKVKRKQCHGDFCSYKDKNVRSDDEIEDHIDQGAKIRPRSSSPRKKQKYTRWTREDAKRKEFNKTNKQVQELREKHKNVLVAEVQDTISTSQMKRNLRQNSPNSTRPSSTGSTSETSNRMKIKQKSEKKQAHPLAFRLIANARVDMQYMSDDLVKWYLTDRAQKRRGDGPWLYVTAPNRTSKYVVGRTVRCLWEWAGVFACVKLQLYAGFDKVFDIVLSTKNDGMYTFDIPKTLYNDLKPHVRGNMWRIKISDTNNPNIYIL